MQGRGGGGVRGKGALKGQVTRVLQGLVCMDVWGGGFLDLLGSMGSDLSPPDQLERRSPGRKQNIPSSLPREFGCKKLCPWYFKILLILGVAITP